MPRNPARSSDSPDEIEPAGIHVDCQGESSDENDENPVSVKHRSQTLMWTFPTPRSYLGSLEDRRKANKFIPRDFTRKDMADIFLDVLAKQGKRDLLKEFIVVMEPHSKMTPDGSAKEMHFHIVFRMSTNFAHLQISNSLDKDYGCKGHMSHPRKGGWPSLVQYVLEQSAVKLPIHLDEHPYFWPDDQHMTKDKMLTRINKKQEADTEANRKRQEPDGQMYEPPKKKGRKRTTLHFNEFVQYVQKYKIYDEKGLWKLAMDQDVNHQNPTVLNFIGMGVHNLSKRLQAARKAIMMQQEQGNHEHLFVGGSKSTSKFSLDTFVVPNAIKYWMQSEMYTKSLIVCGGGGIGKTELAKAIFAARGSYFFVDSLDQLKHCTFCNEEALLFDDVTLQDFQVDVVKSLLDVQSERAVKCRHEDGLIPQDTPRIFLTNHPKRLFFPIEAQYEEHREAIERRIRWVQVDATLFHPKPADQFNLDSVVSPNSMEETEPGILSPIDIDRDGEPRQEFDDDFAGDECEAKRLHQDDDHMNTIRSVPRPLAKTFARSIADLVSAPLHHPEASPSSGSTMPAMDTSEPPKVFEDREMPVPAVLPVPLLQNEAPSGLESIKTAMDVSTEVEAPKVLERDDMPVPEVLPVSLTQHEASSSSASTMPAIDVSIESEKTEVRERREMHPFQPRRIRGKKKPPVWLDVTKSPHQRSRSGYWGSSCKVFWRVPS